jgi:hypothetical protein
LNRISYGLRPLMKIAALEFIPGLKEAINIPQKIAGCEAREKAAEAFHTNRQYVSARWEVCRGHFRFRQRRRRGLKFCG